MKIGLIGEKLGHSFSREIHEKIGYAPYFLRELKPEEVGPFLRSGGFSGLNVTIPYKETVLPYLNEISETAAEIEAVNTIVNRDGLLTGYNTDFYGLLALIRKSAVEIMDKTVMILGTGGTSKTALSVLKFLKAGKIIRVSRTGKNVKNFEALSFDVFTGETPVSYESIPEFAGETEILINTTPVGMFPETEACPVNLSVFPGLKSVIDVIYNPLRTQLTAEAKKRGIPAANGLYMLVAQGVTASRLFRGETLPDGFLNGNFAGAANADVEDRRATEEILREIERIYGELLREKRNLVLIGMPSAGKTTVGKLLAEKTGRRFIDTDLQIAEKLGVSVADFIRENGEEKFRAAEKNEISEVAGEKGCVIATGGGSVLFPENAEALKRNGITVYLRRPLSELLTGNDRPLSDNKEKLRALYEKRTPIYEALADVTVDVAATPEETAQAVIKGEKQCG